MGLFALDIVLWLLGIRGHIPRFDDVRPVPAAPVTGPGNVMRALAAIAAVLAVLSLTLWATVWIAIRLF
jgi:hypothetical protein